MFTGIIEEMGSIRHIARQGQAMRITLDARRILEDIRIGDSIAVNGVCLTVVSHDHTCFTVDVMPETFRMTSLKVLRAGSRVNLERAMAANGRFGGHIVQGHVDAVAVIETKFKEENAVVFTLKVADPHVFRYIIPRGSITIDGISLTVVSAADPFVTVSIIPHTLAETVLQFKGPGDLANLECDLLGKYVEHLLGFGSASPLRNVNSDSNNKLSASFLIEHGFI